jgi:hypothetical protein
MVMNNCVGSMGPLTVDYPRWQEILQSYEIDGEPLFRLPEESASLNQVLTFGRSRENARGNWFTRDRAEMQQRYGGATVITDANLGEEYQSILREWSAFSWLFTRP